MRRTIGLTCTLAISSLLAGCFTADKKVWDDMDAYAAQSKAPVQPESEPATFNGAHPGGSSPPGTVSARPAADGVPTPMAEPLLPRNAAPSPRVAGLEFLTGRWVAVNANKTVNEEIWTPPRGNVLIGTFRQVRLDGDCAFVELSQITAEGDDLVLRLRHLHGRLEVPEGRNEVSLFRLVSLEKDRVEFAGTTGSEGVTSVIYQRTSPTELVQSIDFAPESGEKAFITHYRLDR